MLTILLATPELWRNVLKVFGEKKRARPMSSRIKGRGEETFFLESNSDFFFFFGGVIQFANDVLTRQERAFEIVKASNHSRDRFLQAESSKTGSTISFLPQFFVQRKR